MQFTQIDTEVGGVAFSYQPYDRGANGAFVYRQVGSVLHAPRVVVSATTNDAGSDKMSVQLNTPQVCDAVDDCAPVMLLGTDLVKTELRFLAATSKTDRATIIDKHIALLQELRGVVEDREVIYS